MTGAGVPAVGSHVHGDVSAADGCQILAMEGYAVHCCLSMLL